MSLPPDARPEPSLPKEPLAWLMAGLFIISVVGFVILSALGAKNGELEFELAKALLQVGVVSVAATMLSLLVFNYQRRAQLQKERDDSTGKQLQFRDDLLRDTLKRMTAAYNAAKRARRKLRAVGRYFVGDETFMRIGPYDEYMDVVNEAQLDLEAIKSDVRTVRVAYRYHQRLEPNLDSMEKYLGQLIREYERKRSRVGPGTSEIPLNKTELPQMADFLGPSKDPKAPTNRSKFSAEFSMAHGEARSAIREDLLHLNLPTEIPSGR